jgi:hypothetical protein
MHGLPHIARLAKPKARAKRREPRLRVDLDAIDARLGERAMQPVEKGAKIVRRDRATTVKGGGVPGDSGLDCEQVACWLWKAPARGKRSHLFSDGRQA